MSIQSTFKRYAPMAARVAVYVPGTVGVDSADNDAAARMVEHVAGRLSELFGGATATDAAGFWMSDAVGLVSEFVRIVYSNTTPEALDAAAPEILAIAEHVKSEMRQEAVSVEINGALYII